MISECSNVSLQTESLDSELERNEVMKLAASSYPATVDVAEFVSDASSKIGNVGDPARAAFVAFLAALFLAFFFCFFDKPPPGCDALGEAFVKVAVEEGRGILVAGLWADRDNPEIAEDNWSSSVPVESSEEVPSRGDRGRLRTTKSSSSVSEIQLLS